MPRKRRRCPGGIAYHVMNRATARELFWHYPHHQHYQLTGSMPAIRAGDFKLIEFFDDMKVELYNLHEVQSDQAAG